MVDTEQHTATADEIAQLETKLSAKFQHRETDAAYWWRRGVSEPTSCEVTDCTATAATSFAARSR